MLSDNFFLFLPDPHHEILHIDHFEAIFLKHGMIRCCCQEKRDALDPIIIPKRFWIRLFGVPYGLKSKEGIQKLVPFGRVIDMDMAALERNIQVCVVLVEVASRNRIPRIIEFNFH